MFGQWTVEDDDSYTKLIREENMTTFITETKITYKYLMNKTKSELADMYLYLLNDFDRLQKESGKKEYDAWKDGYNNAKEDYNIEG